MSLRLTAFYNQRALRVSFHSSKRLHHLTWLATNQGKGSWYQRLRNTSWYRQGTALPYWASSRQHSFRRFQVWAVLVGFQSEWSCKVRNAHLHASANLWSYAIVCCDISEITMSSLASSTRSWTPREWSANASITAMKDSGDLHVSRQISCSCQVASSRNWSTHHEEKLQNVIFHQNARRSECIYF